MDLDSAAVAGGGLLQVTCVAGAVAEVVVRRNVLGSELDRLLVTSGRAGCVALVFQDVAQGLVGLGEVGKETRRIMSMAVRVSPIKCVTMPRKCKASG